MRKIGPHYIGKSVNLDSLRGWILELGMTDTDTILLHPKNFDDLVEEHRELYGSALPEPYFLLGVLIDEAAIGQLPYNEVLLIQDDKRSQRLAIEQALEVAKDDGRVIYRCGWCGNLVDQDGVELVSDERSRMIEWLRERGSASNTRAVHGRCCRNGNGSR